MKQTIAYIGALVAAVLAGPQAFAQAKSFEGFSIAGGANIANSNFGRTTNTGAANTSVTSTSADAVLQAQYDYAAGEKFLIGVGATLDLGELTFGQWMPSNIALKMKDRYSLYVAPGYALNNTTLVYAKLAYISGTFYDPHTIVLPGTGLGVGLKIMGGSNVFYQIELSNSDYANREYLDATDKFSINALTLSVGYKF
jgi:hypothetical protein